MAGEGQGDDAGGQARRGGAAALLYDLRPCCASHAGAFLGRHIERDGD